MSRSKGRVSVTTSPYISFKMAKLKFMIGVPTIRKSLPCRPLGRARCLVSGAFSLTSLILPLWGPSGSFAPSRFLKMCSSKSSGRSNRIRRTTSLSSMSFCFMATYLGYSSCSKLGQSQMLQLHLDPTHPPQLPVIEIQAGYWEGSKATRLPRVRSDGSYSSLRQIEEKTGEPFVL